MKNRWECRCKPPTSLSPETTYNATCKGGYCVEWRCNGCGATLGGFGPVGCKCEGYIRELWFSDMQRHEKHVAVKPSILNRRNKKKKKRDRLTVI